MIDEDDELTPREQLVTKLVLGLLLLETIGWVYLWAKSRERELDQKAVMQEWAAPAE